MGPMVTLYLTLKNCQAAFAKWLSPLTFSPRRDGCCGFPHPCQHQLFSAFFIVGILVGIEWYFNIVLICISLMTN